MNLGLDNTVIWIILGVFLALLIGFFIYSFIKEKIQRKKIKEAAELLKNEGEVFHREIVIKVNQLIRLNQEQLDNFEVSIGKYKMSDITLSAHNILKNYAASDSFKTYITNEPKYKDFLINYVALKDNKSNLWANKQANEIKYFEKAFKSLPENYVLEIRDMDKIISDINKEYEDEISKRIKSTK